ncbi:helix-turn-helix domain-containing protein [Paenibacillus sp. NPDC057934]|uniref:helix-turn-helix domain-containing protein n=1 Tax=Paenibacillus sp. NPDC057934 TaxID=3346282 RepID=UPI0036DDB238
MFKPERLEKWRKMRKFTQEDLAKKINMTKAAISNYENGHSLPSGDTLAALADALDIDTDYLLDRTKTPRHKYANEDYYIKDLELTDQQLVEKYNLKVDGETLTPEEAKAFIAFVRSIRS